MRRKIITGVFLSTAIALMSSTAASAHVSVDPKTAEPGSYTKLTFRVPNEKPDATTKQVEIDIPSDHPIPSVSVLPQPGWSYGVSSQKLDKPVTLSDGDQLNEAITSITWTADEGNPGIKSDEFAEFSISAGPLPKDATAISFKALQTYSNGDVVRWIDSATSNAEHPAPTVSLEPISPDDLATKNDINFAKALGILGIVLGGAALSLTVAGFLTRKRA